jgi:uroporphyrinogen-III synthase
MRILVTRPERDAAKTAEKLVALGHQVSIDPVLVVEPVAFEPPNGAYQAITVTSASALRMIERDSRLWAYRALPLFAVGAHTASTARMTGFETVHVAEGDADALVRLIASMVEAGARVLYISGEDQAHDLAAMLEPAKIQVDTLVVYHARLARQLADATLRALEQSALDAVLHYSPRSAANFVALAEKAGQGAALRRLHHYCLSVAVAAPLNAAGATTEVAATPDEAALLKLLEGERLRE